MTVGRLLTTALITVLFSPLSLAMDALPAGEYLLTVTRPGSTLNIIDTASDKVVRQCDLGVRPGSGTIAISPDQKTAYVLANSFSDVYGVDLDTCDVVFSTQQSTGNTRVKSMASMALSVDGARLYTHQTRVRIHSDHYELLDTVVAEFDTRGGLNTLASRTLPAPRQITILEMQENGALLLGGPDVYRMDLRSGDYEVIIKSLNHEDPEYAPRDVLTVWPMGRVNNEFSRLFSTARWLGEPGDLANAEWLWGYESVDLATGEAASTLFGPLEVALFSGVTRPNHRNEMYGVLNYLKVYDVPTKTELRSTSVPHSYYTLNFTQDGSKLYLLGADADVGVYDPETLEQQTIIPLPGDGSLSGSVMIQRH